MIVRWVVGLLLLWTVVSTHASDPLQQFQQCLNPKAPILPTTWDGFMTRNLAPWLWLERFWWNDDTPRVPLTIATHLSLQRLQQLRAQCISWQGPLVAVVHVALLQPEGGDELTKHNKKQVKQAIAALDRFAEEMAGAWGGTCQLRMALFWEVYEDPRATTLYPCNTMRNYALLLAQTPLVSMVDVDLLVSSSLYTQLTSKTHTDRAEQLLNLCQQGKAVVLPAFEPVPPPRGQPGRGPKDGIALAGNARKYDKPKLWDLVKNGLMRQFQETRYNRGHNATDYAQWFTAEQPYDITWQLFYEPWFMLKRTVLKFYDESFRGYFFNKSLYVAAAHYANMSFVADPTDFLVHRPHPTTSALRNKTHYLPLQVEMHRRATYALWQMKQGAYQPAVDSPLLRCASLLPWVADAQYALNHTAPLLVQQKEAFSLTR